MQQSASGGSRESALSNLKVAALHWSCYTTGDETEVQASQQGAAMKQPSRTVPHRRQSVSPPSSARAAWTRSIRRRHGTSQSHRWSISSLIRRPSSTSGAELSGLPGWRRTELPFVNYVRDRRDAQVHVLITREQTGGGGRAITIDFVGLEG